MGIKKNDEGKSGKPQASSLSNEGRGMDCWGREPTGIADGKVAKPRRWSERKIGEV
jgi:hypothetical protein